jgi:hypothetical protein
MTPFIYDFLKNVLFGFVMISMATTNGFKKWRLRNLIFVKLNKLLKHWELRVTVHLPLKGRQILI